MLVDIGVDELVVPGCGSVMRVAGSFSFAMSGLWSLFEGGEDYYSLVVLG